MQGKKTGGRVAGTPNKITIELRKTLKGIIASVLALLPGTLKQLQPKGSNFCLDYSVLYAES
jgi:hypothetical protein